MLLTTSGNPINGYIVIVALVLFWGGAILWGRSSRIVSNISVDKRQVVISLIGPTKLLALRKEIVIPFDSVIEVSATPNVFSKGGSFSRRIGNLTIPTFFRVGSFRGIRGQGASFWACFRGESAVTFRLKDFRYSYVVVDVADPDEIVAMIEAHGL